MAPSLLACCSFSSAGLCVQAGQSSVKSCGLLQTHPPTPRWPLSATGCIRQRASFPPSPPPCCACCAASPANLNQQLQQIPTSRAWAPWHAFITSMRLQRALRRSVGRGAGSGLHAGSLLWTCPACWCQRWVPSLCRMCAGVASSGDACAPPCPEQKAVHASTKRMSTC